VIDDQCTEQSHQVGNGETEGQQLLRQLQVQIMPARRTLSPSAEDLAPYCGKPKRIKDVRTKCAQTGFGADGLGPAVVAPILMGTVWTLRWVNHPAADNSGGTLFVRGAGRSDAIPRGVPDT
jgi:hypothetical protein